MSIVIDVPQTHYQRERGRVVAQGRSTEDGRRCALAAVHELDGSWTIHGLGAAGARAAGRCPVSWYVQSLKDHDTHRGTLSRGSVTAACGIRFVPRTVAFGRKALPGPPPDPDQACPECARKVSR